jgi:hypothetical protein
MPPKWATLLVSVVWARTIAVPRTASTGVQSVIRRLSNT